MRFVLKPHTFASVTLPVSTAVVTSAWSRWNWICVPLREVVSHEPLKTPPPFVVPAITTGICGTLKKLLAQVTVAVLPVRTVLVTAQLGATLSVEVVGAPIDVLPGIGYVKCVLSGIEETCTKPSKIP